jgi:transcription initiation factor TFIIB
LKSDEGTGTARGWAPTGTAAAAIYLATVLNDESVAEKEIAKVAGTTPITIRNRYNELEKRLKLSANVLSSSSPLPKKASLVV